MKITVKRKVVTLASGAAIVPVLVMLGLTIQFQRSVARQAEQELQEMAKANLVQVAKDVFSLCEMSNALLQQGMGRNLRAAHQILSREPVALGSETTTWEAVNQETQQVRTVTLPKVTAGGLWLGQNRMAGVPTRLVDDVKRATSVESTVFQRMNEQGDMVRVATTVLDGSGQRAVGTYIPAFNADGTPNPVIAAVLTGKAYQGPAYVLGMPYISAYEPVTDTKGRVFSMLFVGEKLQSIEAIRQTIMSIAVGKSGHVVVIGAKGDRRGRYIISYKGKRDGEIVLDSKDAQGRFFVRTMVENALTLPKGEAFYSEYPWQEPGEPGPRTKLAALIYFEPWDWLINAGAYEDEYFAAARTVEAATRGLLGRITLAGFAALGLALGFAVILSSRLAKPVGVTSGVAQHIASGNLVEAKRQLAAFMAASKKATNGNRLLDGDDEITDLLSAFETMTANLDSLIGQVQRSGIQVNSSTTQIAASAKELEGTVAEQASSIREVAATTKQISATCAQLLSTMGSVGEAVEQTGTRAQAGHGDLNRMESAMHQLLQATGSISSRLGVISQRATEISSVVTTINKVSDQTGLLSLNAAIEAEKAGEYGKGFSVVAREISRLADQTAAATEEIESVVREMQSSVSGGVMEMDKFSEEVRRRVEEVATVSRQLGAIIDQVQTLSPQFETVNEGMRAQTEGAQQISEAMAQLAESAGRTKEALQEFKGAAVQLHSAVRELQNEVARFRISA